MVYFILEKLGLFKNISSQEQAMLGDDFNLITYFENETKSPPPSFVLDILPNTFSYTVDDQIILTNAFVKAKCQKDNGPEITYETYENTESMMFHI